VNVTQCDTCKKIGPQPAPGWLLIVAIGPPESALLSMLGGSGGGMDVEGTFCGYACAGEYARAKALISEADGGKVP